MQATTKGTSAILESGKVSAALQYRIYFTKAHKKLVSEGRIMNSEEDMGFKLIAFRCPADLLERLDCLASATNSSRSVIIAEAVRVFIEEVRARGGYIVPLSTYDMDAGEPPEAK